MTTMKLSEAIRLGSMLKPHVKHSLVAYGRTCALGAALDAAGALGIAEDDGDPGPYEAAEAIWPILKSPVRHPAYRECADLRKVITSLNDEFDWTREQIADWVETIERQQPQAHESAASAVDQGVLTQ